MARPRVDLHSDGVDELLNAPGVVSDLEDRMGKALSAATASAPVASGDYQRSLHLETVRHGKRTVVRLAADVPYAMFVEAHTGTLARALDAAGGA